MDYGTTINGETYKRNIEKYAYTKAESKSVTADGVEVNVYYSVDDNETGTPDKYEVEVTYRAENGEIDPDLSLIHIFSCKNDFFIAYAHKKISLPESVNLSFIWRGPAEGELPVIGMKKCFPV